MKNFIYLSYLSVLLPILSVLYDTPKSIAFTVNGILFLASISLVFIIYFFEKENMDKFNHSISLLVLFAIYNFFINVFLGFYGLFIYFLLYTKYKTKKYDISNIEGITPIKFLFSKISNKEILLIISYYILLIFIAINF